MPKELRLQATRAAVLLLPDENREALRTLLCLLADVTASVAENQMTPTNLAVCLAPSLFHLNTLRRKESSSPRSVRLSFPPTCLIALLLTDAVIVTADYITYSKMCVLKTGKCLLIETKDKMRAGAKRRKEESKAGEKRKGKIKRK